MSNNPEPRFALVNGHFFSEHYNIRIDPTIMGTLLVTDCWDMSEKEYGNLNDVQEALNYFDKGKIIIDNDPDARDYKGDYVHNYRNYDIVRFEEVIALAKAAQRGEL